MTPSCPPSYLSSENLRLLQLRSRPLHGCDRPTVRHPEDSRWRTVVLCTAVTAQRFAISNLLDVLQSAGNTTGCLGVERIEGDAGSAVDTAVNLAVV